MNPDGQLSIYIISPNTSHAVINTSKTETGVLLEFASEPQHSVEIVEPGYLLNTTRHLM